MKQKTDKAYLPICKVIFGIECLHYEHQKLIKEFIYILHEMKFVIMNKSTTLEEQGKKQLICWLKKGTFTENKGEPYLIPCCY